MNYITAERAAKYIENNMELSNLFKVNHFGNLISLICTNGLFHGDFCTLAYVDCKSETVVINSNVAEWDNMTRDFKRLAEEAIHLEKPFEKIRTNMLVTTLDTYMKGVAKGFSVYVENGDLCLDYYNRPCSSTDRFSMYIDMDPNGYKECYNYLTGETNMFCAKYGELLNDIIND